VGQYQANTVLM